MCHRRKHLYNLMVGEDINFIGEYINFIGEYIYFIQLSDVMTLLPIQSSLKFAAFNCGRLILL